MGLTAPRNVAYFSALERCLLASYPKFLRQSCICSVAVVLPGIESAWAVQCGKCSGEDLPCRPAVKKVCLVKLARRAAHHEAMIHDECTLFMLSIPVGT